MTPLEYMIRLKGYFCYAINYVNYYAEDKVMSYKKAIKRKIVDKRPSNIRGEKFKKIVGENLTILQDALGWTNSQMAELLGMAEPSYAKIKSGLRSLTLEKAVILYYSLDVNLHRLAANDNSYKMLISEDPKTLLSRKKFEFEAEVSNLIADIQNTDSYWERAEKIQYVYNSFGDMLTLVMSPDYKKSKGEIVD